MARALLAPRWLALHAATVAAVAACCLLGWWQLTSYRDTERQRDTAAAAPTVALDQLTGAGRPLRADQVGRRVQVEGRYDGAAQLLVPGRRLQEREGLHVLTPLLTADGGVVPVRRGWVPAAEDPAVAVPPGPVTVTGVLQPSEPERSTAVDPDRDLPVGQVPSIATPLLMAELPYAPERLYEGFVALTEQQPPAATSPTPVPATTGIPGSGVAPWRNLSYGLQWWLFAALAVFFWGSTVRSGLRARPDSAGAGPAPGDHLAYDGALGDERGEGDGAGEQHEQRAAH